MNKAAIRHLFLLLTVLLTCCVLFITRVAEAKWSFQGKVAQSFNYGLDEEFSTEEGLNGVLSSLVVDAIVEPSNNLKFTGVFGLQGDWIYGIKSSDDSWNDKNFDDSRDEIGFDDEWWQIVKEAHITWTPGNFLVRFGKQIISWGETDFVRILDQINPLDGRFGYNDVEFETSIIPITLARVDYTPEIYSTWLDEINFQLWINPNVDWIASPLGDYGNDEGGAWAYSAPFPVLGPPNEEYLGSIDYIDDEPDTWEDMEFGLRVQANIFNTLVGLYYYKGFDKTRSLVFDWNTLTPDVRPSGEIAWNVQAKRSYEDLEYVGVSFTRDLASWRFLPGKYTPIFRAEVFYGFDTTFQGQSFTTLYESDEIRWAMGIDWKTKVPKWINPKQGLNFSVQVIQQILLDIPSEGLAYFETNLNEHNNYTFTLGLWTSYMNAKLTPQLWYLQDVSGKGHVLLPMITYKYNSDLSFTLGGQFFRFEHDVGATGLDAYRHKDQVYFKIVYQFSPKKF